MRGDDQPAEHLGTRYSAHYVQNSRSTRFHRVRRQAGGRHRRFSRDRRGHRAAAARRGATVVTTARNASNETPKAATFIQGDIGTLAGVQAFAAAALDELGGVDIVVNNAAAARAHLGCLVHPR
ncbi:SDR family NAD(P)-dependent oxidoreductase [Micromonospora sp. M12]